MCGGRRAGALSRPQAASKALQPEAADLGAWIYLTKEIKRFQPTGYRELGYLIWTKQCFNSLSTQFVRRFSGETFPPLIVFKIFLHTEGHGYKYFSGKNLLKPSSEAVVDACKMMGEKKFYHQIMEDEHLFQKFKITKKIDIVTLKDYVQKLGLRVLHWYGQGDYEHGTNCVWCPSSFSSLQPLYRRYQQQSQIKHLGRRSKQAQMKVEKMRKAYKMAKEKNVSAESELQMDTSGTKQKQTIVLSTPSFDIVKVNELVSNDELEKEEKELFAWCQDLCINSSPSC
ncbi:putative uncharacterized protein CXorf58 [Camelus dromedarius]|uniref:Uncharacterized protein n=1 Tax=Camelus dromedarius TaxID=9838 RepID=A0A5N4C3A4_CAMDR|nr:putative uncharacterized protein CXorf58 [Camelus dromedarius]